MPNALKECLKKSTLLTSLVRAVRRNWLWPARRRSVVDAYFAKHLVRKLHLGTGPDFLLDGWLASDLNPHYDRGIVYLDATQPFPFEDRAFEYVFSEHQIEHLTYPEGLFMLRECLRVLKPGGKLRLATPDLRVYLDLFARDLTDQQKRYIRYHMDKFLPGVGLYHPALVLNNEARNWGHRFLYDATTLEDALKKAGFVSLKRCASGESDDPNLKGIEFHGKVVKNEEMNAFETMVFEAQRPA
jgi:predicted SAM-dependent methyltransferase